MKKNFAMILMAALLAVGILTGCPSGPSPERTRMPASVSVEGVGDGVIIDLYAGTIPLPALFYDMKNMPKISDGDSHVTIVRTAGYPYWWYDYPAGAYYPYAFAYWVDAEYDGESYPAYDESQVKWGVALHYDNDEIPLTVVLKPFVRGESLQIDLTKIVPNRVREAVDIYLVATYPGMKPVYCPLSIGQSGTFCWGKIGNFTISVNGEVVSEAVDGDGNGLGFITIPWPFDGEVTPDRYTLTTSVQGQGSVTPASGTQYAANSVVPVKAMPATGWSFDHWIVNGVNGSSSVEAQVTMDGDVELVAVFKQNTATTYTLTTSVQGQGSVTPASGTQYAANSVVPIKAMPATGWSFDHWIVNGVNGSSSVEAQVTMSSEIQLVAVFTSLSPTTAPLVEFTRSGNSGTMRIFTDGLTLRQITADASAAYLPSSATYSDVDGIGVEIVNLPGPYWYIAEISTGSMTNNGWSTSACLDGVGMDSNGNNKTVALANWTGGRAIPYYTLRTVPGRKFSINTGVQCGELNGQNLAVDTVGYIWP